MQKKKLGDLRSQRWFGATDLRSFGHRSRALQMGYAREDFLGKPVIDETGLEGAFEVALDWNDSAESSGPSIYTALREQLGLRLDAKKGPVTTYVIERAEKPSEN